MSERKQKLSDWYIPGDWLLLMGFYFVFLPVALFSGMFLPLLHEARRSGDSTLVILALLLGTIGTVLLFFARLPLYRQRRFLAFGPRELDAKHRALYRRAYGIIGASIVLLLLLVYQLS